MTTNDTVIVAVPEAATEVRDAAKTASKSVSKSERKSKKNAKGNASRSKTNANENGNKSSRNAVRNAVRRVEKGPVSVKPRRPVTTLYDIGPAGSQRQLKGCRAWSERRHGGCGKGPGPR